MAGKRLVRVCGKRPPDAARALKLVADDAEECGAICKKKKDLDRFHMQHAHADQQLFVQCDSRCESRCMHPIRIVCNCKAWDQWREE
jgi:hypothetical protein